MKDKSLVFVNSTNLSIPNASLFRWLAMLRGLIENGINVYWISVGYEPTKEILTDPHYSRINFIPIIGKNKIFRKNKYFLFFYRLHLLGYIDPIFRDLKEKYPIVNCYTYNDDFLFLFTLAKICRKHNIKIFNEIPEYPKLKYENISYFKRIRIYCRSRLYLKYFIPNVDHIFVASKALKEFINIHLQKYYKQIPITVLNLMVEPNRYNSLANKNEYKDIVFAGTIYGNQNGVDYLLEAFLKIYQDYPDSRLIIIGDNTRVSRMQKINHILSKVSDCERIIFTGQLNRNEVIKWINSAYCLALARPNNIQAKYGFPTKLGEYLATGKPVVITSVGDIPLFLKDGENAYIAKPDDVDSFADKLRECLDNPELAKLIGMKGKELVYSEFNYKEVTKNIIRAMK